MKTLHLSGLLLACLSIFSCTKESAKSNEEFQLTAQGGSQGGNTSVAPGMTIVYNPSPCIVDQSVVVKGKFAEGEPAPSCGKIQLQQMINGSWTEVGAQVTVTASENEVSYAFTPTMAGNNNYQFRMHYIKGGCSGYSTSFSDGAFLDVLDNCTFSINGTAAGVEVEPGIYEFTVTYTVNPCSLEFNKLKTQGGLTNGTTLISSVGGDDWIPGSSTNNIIRWEETDVNPLSTEVRQYTVVFRKAYNGSGPIEITGDWSAKASMNGVEVGAAEFPSIIFNP